jgi:hypothetical protein
VTLRQPPQRREAGETLKGTVRSLIVLLSSTVQSPGGPAQGQTRSREVRPARAAASSPSLCPGEAVITSADQRGA